MAPEPSWRQKSRPVNLNLFAFRFPVTAIVSILHRLSGVLLFLFVPFLVWVFSLTLSSPDDFVTVQTVLAKPFSRFLVWLFFAGLIYHLFAGIRHLIMDCGIGESWTAGRASAWFVLVLTLLLTMGVGVWLW